MKKQARDAGLDVKKLASDLKKKSIADAVDADIAQGVQLGVQGTPYFLVNNLGHSWFPVLKSLQRSHQNGASGYRKTRGMICTRTLSSMDMPLPLDISAGTSVTIGNFDGVHLGHQALLALTRNRAEAAALCP